MAHACGMRMTLEPLPVLYACQGCPEYGQAARDAGAQMDEAGSVELVWLGSPQAAVTERYPVFAIDGCDKGCALRWLEARGVRPERTYVVSGGPP